MLTVAAGIIMLGILVFVHELGHFAIAKLAGVKVLKFSLGFGPRILSRRIGETEYMICMVPLGGYVLMLGEGNGEQGEGVDLTPEEEARSFARQPVGRRMAIVAAGPIMNLILPFLVLPVAYWLGVSQPAYLDRPACIGEVVSNSVALEAGLLAGDCIESIDGKTVDSWSAAGLALLPGVGEVVEIGYLRDGQPGTASLPADHEGIEGLESIGLFPQQDAVIGRLSPGMPADRAGVRLGDRIVSINGEPVTSWYDLRGLIQKTDGSPSRFGVARGEERLELEIAAEKSPEGTYLVGISPVMETIVRHYPVGEAVQAGARRSVELIDLTLVFIHKLFAGDVPTKNIGGPISVVQVAGQAAQTDLSSIFFVLAFLSIQLGILNLLPIPILDGGHLLFSLLEMFFRRPLSVRTREILQQIGLALLLMLMLLAFYNDITRLIREWMTGG